MNKFQKILVPVDFSEGSANALKCAASLAQETKSELIVLHVFDKDWRDYRDSFVDSFATVRGPPILPYAPPPLPVDRWLQEKSLGLHNFIHTVMGDPGEVRIRRRVELGNPDRKIIRVAKEERADLIVLAIKRRSFFSYLMARSILLKLTWRSPCPVLLTRRHLEEFSGQSGSLIWGRLWKAVP